MKKFISAMIISLLLLPVFSIAGTAAGEIPVAVKTDIGVKTTTDTKYKDSLLGNVFTLPKFQTQATLDMENVRTIVGIIGENKLEKYNILNENGYVKATITVNLKYSKELETIDIDLPKFQYKDSVNTEDFIYNEDGRTAGTEGNYKTITFNLSTDELKLSDLIKKEEEIETVDGIVTVVRANDKLGDIILKNDSVKIQVPDFNTEYELLGDITCIAEIYTKPSPSSTSKTPFRTYKFTGEDKATIKYTLNGGSPTGGASGGSVGSSINKITVSSTVPSGEVPAGTKVGLTASVLGAKIYYTTDGTDPQIDENGNLVGSTKLYSDEIKITENTTLKAIAVASAGKVKSNIEAWDYTVKGIDIGIKPSSGLVKPGTTVYLSSQKGEVIYYTTDGTEPQIDKNGNPIGTTKKYEGEFAIHANTTVRAIAVNADGEISVIATETYKIAPELTKEHIAYIEGYPDNESKPERPISRGEVAEIFARLTVKKIDIETNLKAKFTDVPEDSWYHNSIAFMQESGIINGYADGTFRPDNFITRAEFATMASRFDMLNDVNENIFSDVTSQHWAFFNINSAFKKGWVNGYPGDTNFYPQNYIKRCEAITIINRMTEREAEKEFKDADLTGFIIFDDTYAPEAHWSFYEVVESSNTHDVNKH